MSDKGDGVVRRLVGFVRALLPEDWQGNAGEFFRGTTNAVSQFADEHNLGPKEVMGEAVELGRRKLSGLANKEYADSARDFAEAENLKIEAELKRRSMESKVRQEEAAARLAELGVVEKELDLVKKLQDIGVTLHRDDNGSLTALPLPSGLDLNQLAQRWQHAPPPLLPLPNDAIDADTRFVEGQRLLIDAMRYLAQSDPIRNRPSIELISEHIRTRFRA